jgi:radical SAM-linked protein
VDDRSGGSPAEARQRWRIVFRRDPDVTADVHPETAEAWAAALSGAGLPIATSQAKTPRPRIALAMPLPGGVAGEAELVDFVLTERMTLADVRARLVGQLPAGDTLVDLFDVWLGEPTMAAQLGAADYRVEVRAATTAELAEACTGLVAATSLPRSRPKGDGRVVEYDLRPLLLGLEVPADRARDVGSAATDAVTIRMRLRLSQDAASGRPDEVVQAIGDGLARPLIVERTVRERLVTIDDVAPMEARG